MLRRMRWLLLIGLLGCSSSGSEPERGAEPRPAREVSPPARRPPDDMDERMRHCPLALEGASATLEDIAGGVRFTVTVPDAAVDEARRRARHVVEFAARRTRAGHGGFDGKGGGRMKNCPVITDGVTITVADVPGGARLDVIGEPARIDALRSESRDRARKFPFVGARIRIAGAP